MKAPIFVNAPEDCQWLRDTHLKGCTVPAFLSFILFGNEDSPERLELYPLAEPIYTDLPAAVFVTNHPEDGYRMLPYKIQTRAAAGWADVKTSTDGGPYTVETYSTFAEADAERAELGEGYRTVTADTPSACDLYAD